MREGDYRLQALEEAHGHVGHAVHGVGSGGESQLRAVFDGGGAAGLEGDGVRAFGEGDAAGGGIPANGVALELSGVPQGGGGLKDGGGLVAAQAVVVDNRGEQLGVQVVGVGHLLLHHLLGQGGDVGRCLGFVLGIEGLDGLAGGLHLGLHHGLLE